MGGDQGVDDVGRSLEYAAIRITESFGVESIVSTMWLMIRSFAAVLPRGLLKIGPDSGV